MTTEHLIRELENRLREVGEPVRARGAKAYLKSELEFLGVAARPLREVARAFLGGHPELDHDRLVVASVQGVVTVIQIADTLTVLASNGLGEGIYATPAVAGDHLYLRTVGHLYAFGP